jgi:hypothetical protein
VGKEKSGEAAGKSEVIIDWETGTYGGLKIALFSYADRLEWHRGYKLNSKPREIDCLIIDRLDDVEKPLDNPIAHIFRKHNIVELKNPYEKLDINVMWKVISYAAQYKSSMADVEMSDISVTVLRVTRPAALLKKLSQLRYTTEKRFPGVYYIRGMADIRMQLIVASELEGEAFAALRIQSRTATEEDIEATLKQYLGLTDKSDKELMSAVLRNSMSANEDLYRRLRREADEMRKNVLREIFAEDFEEAESRGIDRGVENVAANMIRMKVPANDIKEFTSLPLARLRELAKQIGMTLV